jgi:hypothetical protein
MAGEPEDRDGRALEWTKVVLLPLVTLVISIVGSWYFTDLSKDRDVRLSRQAPESETRDSKQRLYAQLLTQREQSDATIRKDMFEVVLGRFLSDRQQGNLSDQVLQLELLANNFNQSLDLAPLFKDLARRLAGSAELVQPQRDALRKRLDLTASNVIFKQVDSLSRRGFVTQKQLTLAGWEKSFGKPFIEATVPLARLAPSSATAKDGAITFAVEVIGVSVERREIEIRLRVNFPDAGTQSVDRHFWVGQYDFPMLDNTQLSHGLRTSVVMTDFTASKTKDGKDSGYVSFHLVVFPAASASFKERQDYDDILLDMLRTEITPTKSEGG